MVCDLDLFTYHRGMCIFLPSAAGECCFIPLERHRQ
jgi:hypothetical protein